MFHKESLDPGLCKGEFTIKQTLIHQPTNYKQLLANFAGGMPLAADQLNFIARHEKALSQAGYDALLKYYLKPFYKKKAEHNSFLVHREHLDADAILELRKRLQITVGGTKNRIHFMISPKQFLEFKNAAVPSLILYHGNQFLTGAPFHLGGIPHVVFFQWGNLFGVAKYVVLPEEKALKSNVLIYFEDMNERLLETCVNDIKRDLPHELQVHEQHVHTHHLEKQTPQENYRIYKLTPTPK